MAQHVQFLRITAESAEGTKRSRVLAFKNNIEARPDCKIRTGSDESITRLLDLQPGIKEDVERESRGKNLRRKAAACKNAGGKRVHLERAKWPGEKLAVRQALSAVSGI